MCGKRWIGELSRFAAEAGAAISVAERSPAEVRGPRWLWGALCFVQPVGPVAYLLVGRAGPSGAAR